MSNAGPSRNLAGEISRLRNEGVNNEKIVANVTINIYRNQEDHVADTDVDLSTLSVDAAWSEAS